MAFDTYSGLQTTILNFIGRPGDPAVAPFVPDFVTLFEREANRRLRVIDAERSRNLNVLSADSGNGLVLPSDCWAVRSAFWAGRELQFLPPNNEAFNQTGTPRYYTLMGSNEGGEVGQSGEWTQFLLFFGPWPDHDGRANVLYQVGVPPLSGSRPSNWLLQSHGDAYLYGTLVEAEAFIGNDERAPMWLARRDAAFASIEAYDRKTRWAGPLQIRPDFMDLREGAALPSAGEVAPMPPPTGGPVRVVSPISGGTVVMNAADRALYVIGGPLASLTIRLPPFEAVAANEEIVELGFANSVTALSVLNADGDVIPTAPTNAYGPGATIQMRWVDEAGGWKLWK